LDNESAPADTLQLSAATYNVAETGGHAPITVPFPYTTLFRASVTFATSNGTATAGSDYTAVSQTVSFADGDAANKTVLIPILDDTVFEGDETLNIALTNQKGRATPGSPNKAVLTILDNEKAPAGTLPICPRNL